MRRQHVRKIHDHPLQTAFVLLCFCSVVCDHLQVVTRSRGRPRMLHGQRVALPVAVGDGCIHPQASGKRWGMGGRACRLQLVPAWIGSDARHLFK